MLAVSVPADAKVFVNGRATTSTGELRQTHRPVCSRTPPIVTRCAPNSFVTESRSARRKPSH